MVKTSRDARRHIRALSRLFSGVSEIGEEALDVFIKQYREKQYLRQSIKRLTGQGFLKRRPKNLVLTVAGRYFFRKKFPDFSRGETARKAGSWDGKWRLISFDVPGNYNVKRVQLRGLLREFDFCPIQKSVWVSPNFVDDEFWKLLVKYDLNQYCKAMLVDILEGDEELRKHFKLQ